MIVKDEETIEQALQMLAVSPEGVRYSDRYLYVITTSAETLELQCRRSLGRNDIAIVVPRGCEREMENYATSLTRIREQRAVKEKKDIKEWLREHPEIVEKMRREIRAET